MTSGRHLKEDNRNKILVSEKFAAVNHLKLGDKIPLEMNDCILEGGSLDDVFGTVEEEIVGIFQVNGTQLDTEDTPESQLFDNLIYIDMWGFNQIDGFYGGTQEPTYYKATVIVNDPAEQDQVIARVQKHVDAPWEYFKFYSDNALYENIEAPLTKLSQSAIVVMVVVLVACIAILMLLMQMSVRQRRQEIAVWVSIGIKKSQIILQVMLEQLVLTFLAFLAAVLLTGTVVPRMSDDAFSFFKKIENNERVFVHDLPLEEQMKVSATDRTQVEEEPAVLEEFIVFLNGRDVFFIFILTMIIVIVTVYYTFGRMLKKRPKELLCQY